MRADGLLQRLSAMGPAAQAGVPGLYAWGVTVAPGAWARGAPTLARAAAVVAVFMLGAGVLGDRRWVGRARLGSFWGFIMACAVSWCAAPAGVSPLRMDAPRGLAGVMGWALFAFTSAAPALRRADDGALGSEGWASSHRSSAAGAPYLIGAAVLAAVLQTVGWRAPGAERAILVRCIALATGLAVIGAAAEIALQRHAPRTTLSRSQALRRAMAAFVALAILALAGLLNVALD